MPGNLNKPRRNHHPEILPGRPLRENFGTKALNETVGRTDSGWLAELKLEAFARQSPLLLRFKRRLACHP